MVTARQKSLAGLGLKALLIIGPAILALLQARMEARDGTKAAQVEAQATTQRAYENLLGGVEHLQQVVTDQHDAIIRIQAHVELLEGRPPVLAAATRPTGHGIGFGALGAIGYGTGGGAGASAGRPAPPANSMLGAIVGDANAKVIAAQIPPPPLQAPPDPFYQTPPRDITQLKK